MKNITKKFTMMIAVMVFCLTMGTQSVIPAKAAVAVPMSVNGGVSMCVMCGSEVLLSVKEFTRYVEIRKCDDYSHGPDCWIFQEQYWEAYSIRCTNPACGRVENHGEECVMMCYIHLEQ